MADMGEGNKRLTPGQGETELPRNPAKTPLSPTALPLSSPPPPRPIYHLHENPSTSKQSDPRHWELNFLEVLEVSGRSWEENFQFKDSSAPLRTTRQRRFRPKPTDAPSTREKAHVLVLPYSDWRKDVRRRCPPHTWVTEPCPKKILLQKADFASSWTLCTQVGKNSTLANPISHITYKAKKELCQLSSLFQQGI